VPAKHAAASAIESAPIHGVPLPVPAESRRTAPGSDLRGVLNGAARDDQQATGAPDESMPFGDYLSDQLELPLAASAVPGVSAGPPPGAPMPLTADEHSRFGSVALASPPQTRQEPHPQDHAPASGAHHSEALVQASPRRRRASRRRLPTQRIFSDLAAQAGIPANAYAIGEDVDGAMCLVRTDEGFEVFNSLAGARHEVRVFQDEESAYFYLFGVLVAEAVRTGVLAPRHA
jgi:hypothetical protein